MRSVSRYASFIIFLLLIGCVDSREIDHRSMIVGIGIDQTEDEQFSVTVQIPILQPTDGGASTSNREFKTFTAVGDTVLDAIAQIESQTPTVLFFGHLKVVLFGEKIAAANLKEALEMLDRIPAVANQIYLLIIEGHSVEKFLEIESPLVALPAMYLNRFFQADQKISRTTDVKLFEYQRDIKMISSTTSIPLAHTGKGIITIEDMAVLKDNKLIAKLRGNEVAMSELLKHGKTDEFNYTATMEHNHEQIKVAVSRSKLKATIDFNKSNPVQFVIHIEGEGEIVEIKGDRKYATKDFFAEVNQKISDDITKLVHNTINKMKAKNVEPWLMGHRIWASDYDYFKSLNWEDTGWRDSEFAVTTNFTIEHSGQRGVFEKEKVGR